MRSRKKLFLAMGSNVGDRVGYIYDAIVRVGCLVEVAKVSTLYESQPWGVEDQPAFLNCCLECYSHLEPFELLKKLKHIEKTVGRVERFRWGPREIDIDILIYGEYVIDTEELKVPHPYICDRDFVLVPLLEIAPDLKNPRTGQALSECMPGLEVRLEPYCCFIL